MTPSIRRFLLINLLLSITLITSLAIIGNIFLEHRDLRDHLDAQLSLIATTINAFTSDQLQPKDIDPVQKELNKIPKIVRKIENENRRKIFTPVHELIQFQIFDIDKKMILKTPFAPDITVDKIPLGLSDQWVQNKPWRVFRLFNENTGLDIVVSEQYDFRNEVENHVTKDSIIIMLLTYPFLGLLIWIIVGRGLDSIKRVTRAIRQRDTSYLKPVNSEAAPSEIKPLVLALNNLLQRLGNAFNREKRFAADAAHELRTPLAALKMQAQLAIDADEHERKTSIEKLIQGVDRCTHVVEQLLTLTRMSSENITLSFENVNLVKQAQETIAILVPTALKKQTEIELIADKPKVMLRGIPGALSILLRNLIDNAIRYSPEKSLIQVIVDYKGQHPRLRVIDNGPGIPEELRERVFERFFRALGTKTQGSGLGLGIVSQIVEIHDADINLKTPEQPPKTTVSGKTNGPGLEIEILFPFDTVVTP